MIQKVKGERLQEANATDSDLGGLEGSWFMGTILVKLPSKRLCIKHL
jgi:hypothetical protein